MVGLNDSTAGLNKTWTADFTGRAIRIVWGAGGGGGAGTGLGHGGGPGGGGALATDYFDCVSGTVYTYTIGTGGAGGPYSGGKAGGNGNDSYWGDGTTLRAKGGSGGTGTAAGAGGSGTTSVGLTCIPGGVGVYSGTSGNGPAGGNGASIGDYAGGAGGAAVGQTTGSNGSAKGGGGGAGGGGASNSDGGAGGAGGVMVLPAPDSSMPGYYWLGANTDYTGWTAYSGTPIDAELSPDGNGQAWVEVVGGGGGGKGGHVTNAGGHGGGGGASAGKLINFFKDVLYRRFIGQGGAGTNYGGGAASNGTDSYFTLTPLRVIQKQLTSNVATLWTYDPTASAARKHGFEVGDSVTVASVDATFNGTYTVSAVAADRLSFSYAKVSGNVAATAVTPAANQVTRTNHIVLAKAGNGATGNGTGGTEPAGGDAAACIPSTTTATTYANSGDKGLKLPTGVASNEGLRGGAGGLPFGGLGGRGGGQSGVVGNGGEVGTTPGGGGGGGRNLTNGHGAAGAPGAVLIRYIISLFSVALDGEEKSIVRTKYRDSGGTLRTITETSSPVSGIKNSNMRMKKHPESTLRPWPTYLRSEHKDRFDRATGTFNWERGTRNLRAALAANNCDLFVLGDSVPEGWNSFSLIGGGTWDFGASFPIKGRDQIIAAGAGVTLGGTGMVKACTNGDVTDARWTRGSWTNNKLYLSSSNTGHIATFTPGVTYTGTKVAVVTSGKGCRVEIDGSFVGNTADTAGAGILTRTEFTVSNATHTVVVKPLGGGTSNLFAADLYHPGTGLRVHNFAMGGAKASGGTGFEYWNDLTAAPTNLTPTYKQYGAFLPAAKSAPDAVLVFVGGNDSNSGTSAATIKAGYDTFCAQFDTATTDLILMPDVWTNDRELALMDLAIEDDYGMIDFLWLSRELVTIRGQNYNGDAFGHLNAAGAAWVGDYMADAFLYNPPT